MTRADRKIFRALMKLRPDVRVKLLRVGYFLVQQQQQQQRKASK